MNTCITCDRDLADDETRVCHPCHIKTRGWILDITDLYAVLPDHIAQLTGARITPGPRTTKETPVVGGDALVMTADGNTGSVTSSRRGDRTHAHDQWPNDPPSVAAVLGGWEDAFRLYRGDNAATDRATVQTATEYLLKHLRWATLQFPEWADLMDDLRALRSRLMTVTGRHQPPVKTSAHCFDCQDVIVRYWTDEGLSDDWVCSGCGVEYHQERYMLALADHLRSIKREQADAGFVPPAAAAKLINRSERTVWEWVRRGDVASKVTAGHRFVAWEDVARMDELAKRRVRSA